MAVIINELEVVVEEPVPPPAVTAPAAAPQAAQSPVRPLDYMDLLEWRDRSEWRLLAH